MSSEPTALPLDFDILKPSLSTKPWLSNAVKGSDIFRNPRSGGVGAIIAHHVVGADGVALGFRHLEAVLEHEALVEQCGEGFGYLQEPEIGRCRRHNRAPCRRSRRRCPWISTS